MESIWEYDDGPYTGELMMREGSVPQARDEHISQTNILEPVYYHCNTVQHLKHLGTLYGA